MKQRIISGRGWNFRRIIYLVIGLAILIQSILIKEWIGVMGGAYFAAMGFFGWGCASGNCAVDHSSIQTYQVEWQQEAVDYEEVK